MIFFVTGPIFFFSIFLFEAKRHFFLCDRIKKRMRQASTGTIDKVLMGEFLQHNVGLYVGYIVCVLVAFPLQFILVPTAMTKFATNVTVPTTTWNGAFKSLFTWNHKEGAATLIIGMWVVIAVMFVIRESMARKIVPNHTVHVRQKIYEALLKRYEEEYREIPSGNVITRMLNVAELYVYQAEWVLQDIIPYCTGILIFLIYTWKVHHKVGIAVTTGIGLVALNIGLHLPSLLNASDRREAQLVNTSQQMNNSFSNLMNIYVNDQVDQEVKKGNQWNREYGKEWGKEMTIARNMNTINMIVPVLAFGAVLYILIRLVKAGKINGFHAGALVIVYVSFLTWMQSLLNILPSSLKRIGTMKNSMPFLREIFYHDPCSSRTKKDHVHSGSISFDRVRFTYPGEKEPVLKSLTVSIADKEKVAIVGRSGSGKTTLMKLLLQLYVQDSGAIAIDGQDVSKMDVRYLRKQVNYVNQRTVMSNERIIDNIMYGHSMSEEKVVAIMKEYDLLTVFEDIPGGVYAQAGIQGTNMSLGMQKVVIVLRGILRTQARIYAFDEPVAGLDPATRQKIMRLIHGFCKDKTIICVTHNAEIEQFVDRVIKLNDVGAK